MLCKRKLEDNVNTDLKWTGFEDVGTILSGLGRKKGKRI